MRLLRKKAALANVAFTVGMPLLWEMRRVEFGVWTGLVPIKLAGRENLIGSFATDIHEAGESLPVGNFVDAMVIFQLPNASVHAGFAFRTGICLSSAEYA